MPSPWQRSFQTCLPLASRLEGLDYPIRLSRLAQNVSQMVIITSTNRSNLKAVKKQSTMVRMVEKSKSPPPQRRNNQSGLAFSIASQTNHATVIQVATISTVHHPAMAADPTRFDNEIIPFIVHLLTCLPTAGKQAGLPAVHW